MKKNSMKTRVMGTVLAAICAISAGTAISMVSAGAASVPDASVSAEMCNGRVYTMTFEGSTSYGYDWDYTADSTSAVIKCKYDFATETYTYTATGCYEGETNAILKYATIDGKWHNVPVRFTVDSQLNVTCQQTGREYVTDTRYE